MPSWIDGSLYPDTDTPAQLDGLTEQVDFLARLCAAWDFGLLPDWESAEEVRRPGWREAVEAAKLLTSPAYHLVRSWHDLPPLPYLGQKLAYIQNDPSLEHV
jgi:hypothetical protein